MPGFEDAEGIEIRHNFLEAHHASGVYDAVGKEARLPMIAARGFGNTSVYNYHECLQWSLQNQPSPAPGRARVGDWAANGEYVWVGLSDGLDSHKDAYENIDMRRKVYRAVRGSSQCWVFWAQRIGGSNRPRVVSRRFPCRCSQCRIQQRCWIAELVGDETVHDVELRSVSSAEDARAKKRGDKTARKQAREAKAASFRAGQASRGGASAGGGGNAHAEGVGDTGSSSDDEQPAIEVGDQEGDLLSRLQMQLHDSSEDEGEDEGATGPP